MFPSGRGCLAYVRIPPGLRHDFMSPAPTLSVEDLPVATPSPSHRCRTTTEHNPAEDRQLGAHSNRMLPCQWSRYYFSPPPTADGGDGKCEERERDGVGRPRKPQLQSAARAPARARSFVTFNCRRRGANISSSLARMSDDRYYQKQQTRARCGRVSE